MDVEYEPAKAECYFMIKGEECTKKRIPLCNFCPEHKAFLAALDNPTLIEKAARTWVNLMYVNDEKILTAKVDMELIGDLTNYLNELSERGYSDDEAMDAIADITLEKGMLDDIHKQMGRDPKWKKFEKLVAGIHMLTSQGAEVKFDDHIIGRRTGSNRQIDVSIRFKQGLYDYLAIIECKDYGRKASIDKVEAFRTKMEDVGARHGIMVSPQGFQRGAIKTAEAYNIELFTLTEVKSDWTKTLKAEVFTLPFPTDIEFDYPTFEMPKLYERPQPMEFGRMYFYKDQYNPPIPLSQILADISKRVVADRVPIPCNVRVRCNPPLLTQFPGTSFYTPIYEIMIRMENSRFAFGHEIDMPPKIVKYIYSDIAKERVHEIPAKDVPPIK
jgi:hypothetical protein